jgi:predicted Ser/Thr protein kinase
MSIKDGYDIVLERGFTERQTRRLVEWYTRVRKTG